MEFLVLAVVARSDAGVPVPTAVQLLRAWVAETREMVRVFYGRMPFRWQTPPDLLNRAGAARRGVVFIHGFVCNRGFWAPWTQRLQADGRAFVAVNLEPVFSSIEDYAAIIEDAVQRVTASTGLPPVLVCHSMGGLVARSWLRAMNAGPRVHAVVTIGTPHRGTWLGRFSTTDNGRQMQLNSDWLSRLAAAEAATAQPPFTCWYSNCDNIVFPVSTATLPHAENRLVPGRAHVALAFAPEVMDSTLAALSASEAQA
jgi:triacylglycerol esterase/lipase EstA (alpha/beta hydrolase family)